MASKANSVNPGISSGLVDIVASLDGVLKENLEREPCDCFLKLSKIAPGLYVVCCTEANNKESQKSVFVSIQADETTDISTKSQLVLVVCYIDDKHFTGKVFEFVPLQSATSESIATALKERLAAIIPEEQKSKLICQEDGASVMRDATAGVQKKIKDMYTNAHYIHCYAHQLNLIMQQATSHIFKVKIFFSDLGGFASFFSRSPKHTAVLDKMVARRLPTSSIVRRNFHSQATEHREDLIQCFDKI